jgi:hypothetical protein
MKKNGMDKNKKLMIKQRNQEENLYYEEFQGCKKSWIKGLIFGLPAGILCGLLFSGFEFNDIFFGMSAIMSISCIWTIASFFAVRYTEDFGCSCIPNGAIVIGTSVLGFFAGTYVLAWVALLLCGVVFGSWIFCLFLFTILFPLETLYYWIRYSIEKKSIIKKLERCQYQLA